MGSTPLAATTFFNQRKELNMALEEKYLKQDLHSENLIQDLVHLSAPLSVDILNWTDSLKQHPEAVRSMALLGASIAMTKCAGFVSLESYLELVSGMWHAQNASFKTVSEH